MFDTIIVTIDVVEHFGKVSYSINALGVKSYLQTPHSYSLKRQKQPH
jgi:hypothetical protein